MRLRLVKSLLWFLAGLGLVVVLLRIVHGVGSVVALNDILPWGLWKGGGVVALVPIGGAGFTLAALVYIFHWKRYEPLARSAVLLGLMCYGTVAVGLTFDIGIWWRIVFPVVFWQLHSPLFEIAWCIMLYLGVLVVEFSHAVLERLGWQRLLHVVEKVSIVFVVLGISLSTLHQSSLGTLFLATPYRLHPLWYSDLLPVMFFITAIGLGCLTISWLTLVTHWLYRVEAPRDPLSGLARIATLALGLYGVVRLADLLLSGKGSLLVTPGWDTANFWGEVTLSVLVPVVLLSFARLRQSPVALFWISSAAIVGMSLNRVNVAGLATMSSTETSYFPIWPEWAVTFGLLSAAGLVYLFFVERIGVFSTIGAEVVERALHPGRVDRATWRSTFFQLPLAGARFYSAVVVVAVGVALLLLPEDAVFGAKPVATPTRGPRTVEVDRVAGNAGLAQWLFPAPATPAADGSRSSVLLIDADRNGRYVLFDHQQHAERQVERGATCSVCHHMTMPLTEASSCVECHTDMHLARSIFDHGRHVEYLHGNDGCRTCHVNPELPSSKANTTPCETCHTDLRREGSRVKIRERQGRDANQAPGYLQAMHGLCIDCHAEERKLNSSLPAEFAECAGCHRDLSPLQEILERQRTSASETASRNPIPVERR